MRQAITQALQHWKADSDLAGLRDASAMAKLSDIEQKACRALWTEVDALSAEAATPKRTEDYRDLSVYIVDIRC